MPVVDMLLDICNEVMATRCTRLEDANKALGPLSINMSKRVREEQDLQEYMNASDHRQPLDVSMLCAILSRSTLFGSPQQQKDHAPVAPFKTAAENTGLDSEVHALRSALLEMSAPSPSPTPSDLESSGSVEQPTQGTSSCRGDAKLRDLEGEHHYPLSHDSCAHAPN